MLVLLTVTNKFFNMKEEKLSKRLFEIQKENIMVSLDQKEITKDSKTYLTASLKAVNEAIKPILEKYNLVLTQRLNVDRVVTVLHAIGQDEEDIISEYVVGMPDSLINFQERVELIRKHSIATLFGLSIIKEDTTVSGIESPFTVEK